MAKQTINVPDIGGAENVDVIEVCVAPGDAVTAEDPLIVLESDKASMEVPAPSAGKVVKLLIKQGDQISEGDPILELETEADSASDSADDTSPASSNTQQSSAAPASDSGQNDAGQPRETPVSVPDIGGAEGVDVIEVCVKVGDEVAEGDSLIVLESDKASMEVPSPTAGRVLSIAINEGVKVSEGDAILVLASAGAESVSAPSASTEEPSKLTASESAPSAGSGSQDVVVPDIGGAEDVDVIEVSVKVGDEVNEGDSLIVLESDKASMEVPSPASGKVASVAIKEGDKASEGTAILTLEISGSVASSASQEAPPKAAAPAAEPESSKPEKPKTTSQRIPQEIQSPGSAVYAGPAVRKLARQLGVDLTKVQPSGPRGRFSKDDVKAYVKNIMQSGGAAVSPSAGAGAGIPAIPEVDFAKFGDVETVEMSKIQKITAANMTRNWLNVPHVTQFDEADISDLEDFRKGMKAEAEKSGIKLTPLPFLLKACAAALRYEPSFNVSLHADGAHLVRKKYIHIGIAVATPKGLMVPVVHNVDQKGLLELAEESNALAKKARDGKLLPKEMQGGCFTISSLGAIGGSGFTPIVNAPEVGILGVSKASIKPVWNGKEFLPRQMLPLCLSYDHRAINGADAGNFLTYLVSVMSDIRRLSL